MIQQMIYRGTVRGYQTVACSSGLEKMAALRRMEKLCRVPGTAWIHEDRPCPIYSRCMLGDDVAMALTVLDPNDNRDRILSNVLLVSPDDSREMTQSRFVSPETYQDAYLEAQQGRLLPALSAAELPALRVEDFQKAAALLFSDAELLAAFIACVPLCAQTVEKRGFSGVCVYLERMEEAQSRAAYLLMEGLLRACAPVGAMCVGYRTLWTAAENNAQYPIFFTAPKYMPAVAQLSGLQYVLIDLGAGKLHIPERMKLSIQDTDRQLAQALLNGNTNALRNAIAAVMTAPKQRREREEREALRRKQEQEALRKQQEEEARQEALRKQREEQEALHKQQEEEARQEALRRKQEREALRKQREEQEALRKQQEEEARQEALRRKQEREARRKQQAEEARQEALRKQQEAEEAFRRKQEREARRKQQAEEARQEALRKQQEAEEAFRRKQEREARRKQQAEEARQEALRKQREEQETLRKQQEEREALRKQREEQEALRKQQEEREALRKQREEQEARRKQQAEREALRKQQEKEARQEALRRKQEREALRKQQEEQEALRRKQEQEALSKQQEKEALRRKCEEEARQEAPRKKLEEEAPRQQKSRQRQVLRPETEQKAMSWRYEELLNDFLDDVDLYGLSRKEQKKSAGRYIKKEAWRQYGKDRGTWQYGTELMQAFAHVLKKYPRMKKEDFQSIIDASFSVAENLREYMFLNACEKNADACIDALASICDRVVRIRIWRQQALEWRLWTQILTGDYSIGTLFDGIDTLAELFRMMGRAEFRRFRKDMAESALILAGGMTSRQRSNRGSTRKYQVVGLACFYSSLEFRLVRSRVNYDVGALSCRASRELRRLGCLRRIEREMDTLDRVTASE